MLLLAKITDSPSVSERHFGLLFSLIFLFIGVYGLYKSWSQSIATIIFITAVAFLALALIAPKALAPLNKAWFLLGLLLGKIVSPIVLAAIFFLLLTPVAVITRAFGRDELQLKRQNVRSYWVQREPVGPDDKSFKNQF